MVWTSVFFEMKIILQTKMQSLLLCAKQSLGCWSFGPLQQGNWGGISKVSVLFSYGLHIIIAEDPETINCSITYPLN